MVGNGFSQWLNFHFEPRAPSEIEDSESDKAHDMSWSSGHVPIGKDDVLGFGWSISSIFEDVDADKFDLGRNPLRFLQLP